MKYLVKPTATLRIDSESEDGLTLTGGVKAIISEADVKRAEKIFPEIFSIKEEVPADNSEDTRGGLEDLEDDLVIKVSGIGQASADLLADLGITTVGQLADADAEDEAFEDVDKMETWIEAANAYLDA